MPSTKVRVQGTEGGYLVRTNAAGFRSDREFIPERPSGMFRALLFGDSQSAGNGMSNGQRFSDLLEASLPGLEVNNYALPGTAPDQHYLNYEEHADTEHDLIVIGLYVENICRLTCRVVKVLDGTDAPVFRAKPYFQLDKRKLKLHNVPVPKVFWTQETLPKDLLPFVYSYDRANYFFGSESSKNQRLERAVAPFGLLGRVTKRVVRELGKQQPFPEYDSPDNPAWSLLRTILVEWIAACDKPVLLLPLPHYSAMTRLSDARPYQRRFKELADETGCYVHDPLPELLERTAVQRRTFWSDAYGHLSVAGHASLAEVLSPVFQSFMARRQPARCTT